MSDSNRGERSEVGLRRWLIPAIIFAVAILAYGGVQNGIYYNEASRNAATYSSDAKNQIAAECGMSVANKNCAREIEQARRQNQRDEYDLYSQKAMALWTGIMGAMTVIGISLSGVGVYLIWRTWDATREAAENSRKTLDSYVWKERGHVEVVEARYISVAPEPFRDGIIIDLRNVGLSPVEVSAINFKVVPEAKWKPHGMDITTKRVLIPADETRGGWRFDIPETQRWLAHRKC